MKKILRRRMRKPREERREALVQEQIDRIRFEPFWSLKPVLHLEGEVEALTAPFRIDLWLYSGTSAVISSVRFRANYRIEGEVARRAIEAIESHFQTWIRSSVFEGDRLVLDPETPAGRE